MNITFLSLVPDDRRLILQAAGSPVLARGASGEPASEYSQLFTSFSANNCLIYPFLLQIITLLLAGV